MYCKVCVSTYFATDVANVLSQVSTAAVFILFLVCTLYIAENKYRVLVKYTSPGLILNARQLIRFSRITEMPAM